MNTKRLLKVLAIIILGAAVVFSLSIYIVLQRYRHAIKKTEIATQIVKNVFDRRLVAQDYLITGGERAKHQWLRSQENLYKLIISNSSLFTRDIEEELVTEIHQGLDKSGQIFNEIGDMNEIDLERNTRLASRLSISAQETTTAADKLYRLNNSRAEFALNFVILLFSSVATLFFGMLGVSFWIIWKNATDLEKANEKLKGVDKLKDEFVSIASHELRTPMGAIRAFVSMILAGDYGPVNENLKEPLTDIKSSTERLVNLVNDLLNVARIEAGRMKFNLRDEDVSKIAKQIVDEIFPLAQERKINLNLVSKNSFLVQADADKLKQVLNNLIGNALKFTEKGEIKVETEEVDGMVEVRVSDTGMGIAQSDRARLFGKFEQVSSTLHGKPTGTGLGLYISREIIRKMGGELWLKSSEVDRGSVFAFTVPKTGSVKAEEIKKSVTIEAEAHPDQK